jgi:hypothetical protein
MKIEQFIWMIGFIMPLVTERLIRASWSRNLKNLVAFALSLILGAIQLFALGEFDTTNILASVGAAFTASQIAYDQYFKAHFEKREDGGV